MTKARFLPGFRMKKKCMYRQKRKYTEQIKLCLFSNEFVEMFYRDFLKVLIFKQLLI